MNMYQTYTHAVKETNNWMQQSNIDRTQKSTYTKDTKMIFDKKMIIELVSTQYSVILKQRMGNKRSFMQLWSRPSLGCPLGLRSWLRGLVGGKRV